nr:MAG TPA_asm: hypothetical protein [Caudoviricetes sp.]
MVLSYLVRKAKACKGTYCYLYCTIARFYVLSLGDHRPYLRDNLCNMSYRVVFGNVFRIYVFLDGK